MRHRPEYSNLTCGPQLWLLQLLQLRESSPRCHKNVIRIAANCEQKIKREGENDSLRAYSDEDNQCSRLIVISIPGWCDQSSERSDAGFCIL